MFENKKLENSDRKKEYFIKYDEDVCKIFIDAYYKGGRSFDDRIAKVINTIIGKKLRGSALTALAQIMSCDLSCMHTILDEYEIINLADSSDPFIPPLGSFVPERYYHLLSQDCVRLPPSTDRGFRNI